MNYIDEIDKDNTSLSGDFYPRINQRYEIRALDNSVLGLVVRVTKMGETFYADYYTENGLTIKLVRVSGPNRLRNLVQVVRVLGN